MPFTMSAYGFNVDYKYASYFEKADENLIITLLF